MAQTLSSRRAIALAEVSTRSAVTAERTPKSADILEEFGTDVLDDEALRKLLSESLFDQFKASKEGELDALLADQIAACMKEWAISKGATHFTHWFQPMTGATAEKHDSFLNYDFKRKKLITSFDGKELIKGETDGSSFPSGGIRSTFEARGYTAWDMTSPAFIRRGRNGNVLCIPTAFLSWTGAALDTKAPLLRSEEALSRAAVKLLHLFGDEQVASVHSTLGAEQEFFLIDRSFYFSRPDLVACGRSLIGAKPSKGQQLEDHYFAKMPPRVLACLQEVEQTLWRLGVPCKTRHNEVSPSQYEMAPIFERSSLAADHNMLVMDVLTEVAERHNLCALMNEKPFQFVNGSGKHNNWSLSTDQGDNLLSPGKTPSTNTRFMLFLAAVIRALHLHGDLLRASVAVPGNDHRLGANEAPPAIISIYLGQELDLICTDIINNTEKEKEKPAPPKVVANGVVGNGNGVAHPASPGSARSIRLGVHALPRIPKDTTDRNRTSPFAFTGNKFEFRAVGASQSCAVTVYHLNTIVAESINYMCDQINAKLQKGVTKLEAFEEVVSETLRSHYDIVFNGNNYAQEWVEEATKRGLPILRTAPEALKVYDAPKNVALFSNLGVLSPVEVQSRTHVVYESFLKRLEIEASTMHALLTTHVRPAAIKHQHLLATSYSAAVSVLGADAKSLASQKEELVQFVELIDTLNSTSATLHSLIKELYHSKRTDSDKLAEFHPKLSEAMHRARHASDALEQHIDDGVWPLPKYSEILFMK